MGKNKNKVRSERDRIGKPKEERHPPSKKILESQKNWIGWGGRGVNHLKRKKFQGGENISPRFKGRNRNEALSSG